jgi:site-specific DNA-adenine methylase
VRPPFRYYGSKIRMAPFIISLMPAHRIYIEPFAGSLSVLFAKDRVQHEVVNDLNGDIVRFLRLLRDEPVELARLCRLTPHSRMLQPDPELRRAMAFRDDYILIGNKSQMTAGLGNAVTPPVASWITERCLATLRGGG